VPYVRGAEISRRPGDVVDEARRLVADGVTEITLLGQNVNSYGRDLDLNGRKPLFADLLRQVGAVEGLSRLRYTSPHPKDIREDVMYAMAETPSVCEQLHLPLQSGSASVLAAMHRGYNAERFLGKLAQARDIIDDLSVSTDIIVGFPGETEKDFQATLDVVAEARFDTAFMFQYSPRPGTPAAEYDDQVPKPVIQERFDRLIELQNRITSERYAARIGQRHEILVEGPSKRDPSRITGRTRGNAPVHVEGFWDSGEYVTADIVAAGKHHLIGEAVS
jgi:tRNA-2-methylthio-N6-dimethylallyladenosine synthase